MEQELGRGTFLANAGEINWCVPWNENIASGKNTFQEHPYGQVGVEGCKKCKATLQGLAVEDLAVEIKAWCGTINSK